MQRQFPEGRPGLGAGGGGPGRGVAGDPGVRHGVPRLGLTQRLKAVMVEGSPTVRTLAMCAWVEEGHCGRPAREEEATGFAWVGAVTPPPELVRLTHDPPAGYALPSWKLSKGISRSPPRYPGKKEGGVQEAGSAGRGKGHLKEGDKLPGLT